MQKRFLLMVSLVLAATALTSCSGTGAGVNPPGASTLSVTFSLKQLGFTWTAASGNPDHYALLFSPDGVAAFTQVGSNMPPSSTSLNLSVADHLLNWPAAKYEITLAESYDVKETRTATGDDLARLRVEIAAKPGSMLIRYAKVK